jgi:uncharacterized protein
MPVVKVSASVDTEDALVVCCFPSVSMVSSIVAHYLIERLDLTFCGGVRHPRLPAVCLVQDGAPMPPIRFYAGQPVCTLDSCDKLIVIVSEVQIHGMLALPLTEALLEWSKEANTGAGILVDSFSHGVENMHELVDDDDTDETILGIGTTEENREQLSEMGIPLLKHGVIGGMTGVLLGEGRRRGLNMMAIMAEAAAEHPDARAAARVIDHLDMLLPAIKLDTKPLIEEAERIEGQIKSMMMHKLQASEEDLDPSMTEGASSMLYG